MTRTEIAQFIESGVKLLTPKTEYGRGRISEWNSGRKHNYPKVWQVTSEAGPDTEFTATLTPIDNWPIELRIAFMDSADSIEEQYEDLVDRADRLAQRLMYQLNQVIQTTPTAMLSNINRSPFIKKNADDIT